MRFERASYYCPLPMLSLDPQWHVADYNLALAVLMGNDLDGVRGMPAREWLGHVATTVSDQLFPHPVVELLDGIRDPKELAGERMVGTAQSTVRSPSFGDVDLSATSVCLLDRNSGEVAGAVISWTVDGMADPESYRRQVLRRCRHHLVWELYAVSYDLILPHLDFYSEVVDRHVAALSGSDIRNVADLGAGTGNVAMRLLDIGKNVLALDLSRSMLEKLRSKLPADPPPAITLMEANAETCPRLESGAFDAVNLLLTMYDMQRPHRALAQALRLLRPGGTLVITEPKECFRLEALIERAEQILAEKELLETNRPHMERVFRANRELDPTEKPGFRAEAILESLQAAGFMELSMQDSHEGHCATILGRKP